jgi:hypothetical protein
VTPFLPDSFQALRQHQETLVHALPERLAQAVGERLRQVLRDREEVVRLEREKEGLTQQVGPLPHTSLIRGDFQLMLHSLS